MAATKGKVEPNFGLDNFGRAKYANETEAIANAVLNLLFGKPGFFPSMPNLGINIQEILYSFWDDVDTSALKARIAEQCSEFADYINAGSLDVQKTMHNNQPLLLIVLPTKVIDGKETLSIGITQDKNGNTTYNYVYV